MKRLNANHWSKAAASNTGYCSLSLPTICTYIIAAITTETTIFIVSVLDRSVVEFGFIVCHGFKPLPGQIFFTLSKYSVLQYFLGSSGTVLFIAIYCIITLSSVQYAISNKQSVSHIKLHYFYICL